LIHKLLRTVGEFFAHHSKVCAHSELHAHISHTFRFNHIRQMAPMADADAKILAGVGELTLGFAMYLVVFSVVFAFRY